MLFIFAYRPKLQKSKDWEKKNSKGGNIEPETEFQLTNCRPPFATKNVVAMFHSFVSASSFLFFSKIHITT
jgi:hypothetical protein